MDIPMNDSGMRPMDNSSMRPMDMPKDNFTGAKDIDLRNNNATAVPNKGEAIRDVMSKLIGLDRIAPNFKEDKNLSNNQKPSDNRNAPVSKDDNMSRNGPVANNNSRPIETQNTLFDKNTVRKVMNSLKPMGMLNNMSNNTIEERAKL